MNRGKRNIIIFGVLFTILLTVPTYGKTNEKNAATASELSQDTLSTPVPRGLLISVGYVQVSNENNGILGVYAETLCHTNVDRITMRLYLDILDPGVDKDDYDEDEDWHTVTFYDYNWRKEDLPNEVLSAVSVSFDIHRLERGRFYRIRCGHYIYGGDLFEGRSSQTAFIPLR